jgi:hypothetical protein
MKDPSMSRVIQGKRRRGTPKLSIRRLTASGCNSLMDSAVPSTYLRGADFFSFNIFPLDRLLREDVMLITEMAEAVHPIVTRTAA